jgi:hypothetical protein
MPCEQSLFAQTREGAIALGGDIGTEVIVEKGQSGRIDGPQSAARQLAVSPEYFRTIKTPEPEGFSVNLDQLFGADVNTDNAIGVFVSVHEGRVLLAQSASDVTLDAGESAFAGQSLAPVKLFSSPDILDRDPFLGGVKFSTLMCRR